MRWAAVLLLTFATTLAQADSLCARELREDATRAVINYLEVLFAQNDLSIANLRDFQNALATRDELKNPLPAKGGTTIAIHRRALQEFIDLPNLNHAELLAWATEVLRERESESAGRDEKAIKTERVFTRAKFLRVEPGSVDDITLTHPIEVMQTVVTQKMWAELMGANGSHHRKGEDAIAMEFLGKQVLLQPENPVEQVMWNEALEFANRMSLRDGFPPTYEIVGPSEARIIAPDGDCYRAEGYRLPTAAEMIYLMSGQGKPRDVRFPGVNETNLDEFACPVANFFRSTEPVATAKPFSVDGQAFYDLLGNVGVWVQDGWSGPDAETMKKPRGTNPVQSGPTLVGYRPTGTGIVSARMSHEDVMQYDRLFSIDLSCGYEYVGLRLVRTLE